VHVFAAAPLTRPLLPQIPGVPLLFVHSTGVGLELPTEEQRHEAVRASRLSHAMPHVRADTLHMWHMQEVHGAVPAHERHALQLEAGAATRVRTNVQFKRNVAKGPNPLSMKRKRKAGSEGAQQAHAAAGGGDGEVRACVAVRRACVRAARRVWLTAALCACGTTCNNAAAAAQARAQAPRRQRRRRRGRRHGRRGGVRQLARCSARAADTACVTTDVSS
jgi:hypothetical protein